MTNLSLHNNCILLQKEQQIKSKWNYTNEALISLKCLRVSQTMEINVFLLHEQNWMIDNESEDEQSGVCGSMCNVSYISILIKKYYLQLDV